MAPVVNFPSHTKGSSIAHVLLLVLKDTVCYGVQPRVTTIKTSGGAIVGQYN